MKVFAIAALFSFMPTMKSAEKIIDVDRLLGCIAEQEQGTWNTPGGKCNISYSLWSDHSNFAYQLSGDKRHAVIVYKLCIHEFMARLRRLGYTPTPEALGSIWRHGFSYAELHHFKTAYGTRTGNLYADKTWEPKPL